MELIFWSKSYLIISTGGANIEIIKKYIQNQDELSIADKNVYYKRSIIYIFDYCPNSSTLSISPDMLLKTTNFILLPSLS